MEEGELPNKRPKVKARRPNMNQQMNRGGKKFKTGPRPAMIPMYSTSHSIMQNNQGMGMPQNNFNQAHQYGGMYQQ